MIRQPSDRVKLYAWHAAAVAALAARKVATLKELANLVERDEFPPIHEDEPECGWFRAKVHRHAVLVPARIWLKSVVDDVGELVEPEVLLCEIAGEPFDAMVAWPKLCIRPIEKADFTYMMQVREWAQASSPEQPQAETGKVIDWLTVKIPPIPATPTPPPKRKR